MTSSSMLDAMWSACAPDVDMDFTRTLTEIARIANTYPELQTLGECQNIQDVLDFMKQHDIPLITIPGIVADDRNGDFQWLQCIVFLAFMRMKEKGYATSKEPLTIRKTLLKFMYDYGGELL
jgi:hypothetical protein